MIEVVLSPRCVRQLKRELIAAGPNEIGGVLAAEQVADGRFVVVDLSVQRNGTSSHFVRDPVQHRQFIKQFHERMGHAPERFNYLGEWHSHPSYPAIPSKEDLCQMQALVEDKEQNSTFLVLMVVKLGMEEGLRGSVYGFRPACLPIRGSLFGTNGRGIEEEPTRLVLVPREIQGKYDID